MAVPDEAEEGYSDKPEVKPEAKRPRPPKEGDDGYAPEPRPRRPAPDSERPRRKRPRYDDDDDYPDVRRRDDYDNSCLPRLLDGLAKRIVRIRGSNWPA